MQLQITGNVLTSMKDRQIIRAVGRRGTVRKIVRNKFGVKVIVTVPKRYAKVVVPEGCVSRSTDECTTPKPYCRRAKKYCKSDHPRNLDGDSLDLLSDDDYEPDRAWSYNAWDDLWYARWSSSETDDLFGV